MHPSSTFSVRREPKSWADLLSVPPNSVFSSLGQPVSNLRAITYEGLLSNSPSGHAVLSDLFNFNSNVLVRASARRRGVAEHSLVELQAAVAETWDRGELSSLLAGAIVDLYPDATCLVFTNTPHGRGFQLSGMSSRVGLDAELLSPLIEDLGDFILDSIQRRETPTRILDTTEYLSEIGEDGLLPEDVLMFIVPTSAVRRDARHIPYLRASVVVLTTDENQVGGPPCNVLHQFTSILVWQLDRIHAIERMRE